MCRKSVVVLGLGVVLSFACAAGPKFYVADGKIVLDSPFALQIGSTNYARAFGDFLHMSSYANYDPLTKTTTTNINHVVEARLSTPYFGCEWVSLTFEGEEKAFKSCHFSVGENGCTSGKMTYADCCETIRKIAADMEKRLGVRMRCGSREEDEETIKARVEEKKKSKKWAGSGLFALGFNSRSGNAMVKGVSVDYTVSGMYSSEGRCYVSCSYSKAWDWRELYGNKIPVYTNRTASATSDSRMLTKEQKQAHEEAKKLRETIQRLFGIDFDKPDESVNLLSAVALTNAEKDVKREWTAMEKPFEGLTERRLNQSISFLSIPFGVCALRCPYAGDVSAAELETQAKRILAGLEREYGEKIPKVDTKENYETLVKRLGEGVPTFGDTRALIGLDKTTYYTGRVGDLAVEIAYAEPRYVKKADKYEIACKGAVVMNIVQSPFIGEDKPKK